MLSKNPKLEKFFYQFILIELLNNFQAAFNKNKSIECIDTAIFIWKHNKKYSHILEMIIFYLKYYMKILARP